MSNLLEEMKDASREELLEMLEEMDIKYKQVQNDLDLTNSEKNENALKYLELMSEVEEKNQELHELKDHLQDLVNEKTAELLKINETLVNEIDVRKDFQQKAEKMAEEAKLANAAKSEFLANMSHEIRTPLNAIINMTKITLESELTRKQREQLQTVKTSSFHLLTVINDILDFSKIEAGKLEIENRDFDLHQLLHSTEKTMKAEAEKKNLYIKLVIDDDVPSFVSSDESRIRQVLINLIGNAIKFTQQGGITVSIQDVSPDNDNIKLRFSIRDTGIGIPPERQAAIFDYFSQVDSSISRRFGGTGLGLAISKQLVTLMGGDIWLESEVDQGSCFFFTISCRQGDPTKIDVTETSKLTISLKKLNILVAEDNKVNAQIAQHFLSQMGHAVTVAEDGEKTVRALTETDYDLILMDVEMPVYDGFETTRRIRKGEAGDAKKNIPVIAMTAHAISGFKERCLECGMNEYLTKPVDAKKLAKAISEFYDVQNSVLLSAKSTSAGQPATPDKTEDSNYDFPHLDIDNALKLYNGNEELIKILANVYLDETPEILGSLKQALDDQDLQTVSMHAHSLKSSSAAIGADRLSKIAVDLESIAKEAKPEQSRKLYELMAAEFSEIKPKLEDL